MKLGWLSFILPSTLLALPSSAQAPDAWSGKINWRTPDGFHAVAVHAALLPDGRVFFIGYARDTEDPQAATASRRSAFHMVPAPPFGEGPEALVTEIDEPVDFTNYFDGQYYVNDDLFCTGQALTSAGELFTAGGTRYIENTFTGEFLVYGIPFGTLYDGKAWTRLSDMAVSSAPLGVPARWYSAVTRLHDGRMLVTGGYDIVGPFSNPNLSAEIYDPASGTWQIVSDYGTAPIEIFSGNYTHIALLPEQLEEFELVMFGDDGAPVLLALTPPTWSVSEEKRTGTLPGEEPNGEASSALLPIRLSNGEWGYANGAMLVTGGAEETSHASSVDVYDPSLDGWMPRLVTGVARTDPTCVLLPDGRIVVAAGYAPEPAPDVSRATYVDPAAGFTAALGDASGAEVRGYHNVALLLPDGRVLVGGGQDAEFLGEKSSFRYLYPPYMFASRPVIHFAPSEFGYGEATIVPVSGQGPFEVVLMGLGAMTHSFDNNQRYVQLAAVPVPPIAGRVRLAGPNSVRFLQVSAPSSPRVAPPGYYMLFVLDRQRIPSEAAIVHLE